MAPVYEDYVWRLTAASQGVDIPIPQDLEWVDEFTWSPVQQKVETSLTGALVIQESVQLKGRPITLQGKDDMAWINRTTGEILLNLKNIPALTMQLRFQHYAIDTMTFSGVPLVDYEVMFRHYEPPPLELESVLRFDNFESTSWYKVRNIKFMEALSSASSPCSANVTLVVSSLTGTFNIGDTVTGDTSSASGTVMTFGGSSAALYVASGTFVEGEVVRVDASNYATIDSIS